MLEGDRALASGLWPQPVEDRLSFSGLEFITIWVEMWHAHVYVWIWGSLLRGGSNPQPEMSGSCALP